MERNNQQLISNAESQLSGHSVMRNLELYLWAEIASTVIVIMANQFFITSVSKVINTMFMCFSMLVGAWSMKLHPEKSVKKKARLQLVAILLLTVINVALTVYFKISNAA